MNVPNVPGVPPLNRVGNAILPNIALLAADAFAVLAFFRTVTWGIYDQNGRGVLIGNSVKALSYINDSAISDYPVEQGGFASYNKVANPFDVKVTFMQGGTISQRSQFLASCQALLRSLALFQVITPEVTYRNVNVVGVRLPRNNERDANLLTVDVFCREIRQAPSLQFTTTRAPDAASIENGGTVQAQPLTTDQAANVRSKITVEDLPDLP